MKKKENPKKDYLKKVKLNRIRMEIAQSELESIKARLNTVKAIQYDREKTQSSLPQGSEVEDTAIMLSEAREKYLDALKGYQTIRDEAVARINRIEDSRYSGILYARYIEELSWKEIAFKLRYSECWIRHMHGSALQALSLK